MLLSPRRGVAAKTCEHITTSLRLLVRSAGRLDVTQVKTFVVQINP
jgi:hypothetical protein